MKRIFVVSGHEPAHSKAANDFLKRCDLGISGVFVPFVSRVIVTQDDSATDEQIAEVAPAIKKSFERVGCLTVCVFETTGEEAS